MLLLILILLLLLLLLLLVVVVVVVVVVNSSSNSSSSSIVCVDAVVESEPRVSVTSMDEIMSNSSAARHESTMDSTCSDAAGPKSATPRHSVRFAESTTVDSSVDVVLDGGASSTPPDSANVSVSAAEQQQSAAVAWNVTARVALPTDKASRSGAL